MLFDHQSSFDIQQSVLHNSFNIETHKSTFTNYLEVIILADGTVEYAVPSHQEKLIQLGMQLTHQDKETFYNSCPREYWFDVIAWLSKVTGAIAVWNDHFEGWANVSQVDKLLELREAGLYRGPIENRSAYC